MKNNFIMASGAMIFAAATQAADIVVIVNSAAPAATKEQVADVYLGKSRAFVPHDLPDSAPLRAEFYQKATGRSLVQVRTIWSGLVFSGKGQAPTENPDAESVKKAVAADPKAMGYIEKSDLDGTVKAAFTLN